MFENMGGGQALGGILGYVGQMQTNELNEDMFNAANNFSANQAAINREFQERMSSTAYQRTIKDMIDAGLNPMLAYSQGGASSPNGSSASSIAAPKMENPGAAGAQSAAAITQMQNVQADTDLKTATAQKTAQETKNLEETGRKLPWETKIAELERDIKHYQQKAESARDNFSRERAEEEIRKTRAEIRELEQAARHHGSGARIQEYQHAEERNKEAFQLKYPTYNQDVGPFVRPALDALGTASRLRRR